MSWNYRFVKTENTISFREVYYDSQGNIKMWTERDVAPAAESMEELRKMTSAAFKKPVLVERDGKLTEK